VTGWLLDTNVLSELRRPKPEAKVVQFVSGQPHGGCWWKKDGRAVTLSRSRTFSSQRPRCTTA
jgi:hypothetical protein